MDNPYPICENCIFVDEPLDKDPCQECNRSFLAQGIKPNFVSKRKPQTNADRIRDMTDEELAAFLYDVLSNGWNAIDYGRLTYPCSDVLWLEWLKAEVDAE